MRTERLLFGWAVIGMGLWLSTPLASAQKVAVEKTPKAVMDAFRAKFPGFTVTGVKKEVDAGKPAFEIESNKDGVAVDALLRPDGTFITIEKQIKDGDLPAPVASAVKARYPKAKWEKVEEITTGDKLTYEITLKKADGGAAVGFFEKDGKFIEEE